MRRAGAARPILSDEDKDVLGAHMDDYFGPKEDNPEAEDAYEWAWVECTRVWQKRYSDLIDRVAGPHEP